MSDGIPYQLIYSKRRTIALQIRNDGEVIVRAPMRTALTYISTLLEEKRVWIMHSKQIMRTRSELHKGNNIPQKHYVDGEVVVYLGKVYQLKLYDGKEIAIEEHTSELLFPKKFLIHPNKKIVAWYKKMAYDMIEQIAQVHSTNTGWKYSSLTITSAKTRLGSCSGTRINFTWRLIMAPYESIEYVVVHELAHIKEKNHGKRFWDSVERILPDYKKRKQWLKDNQYVLLTAV